MDRIQIDTLFKEDTTVWYPLKNGDGECEAIPYSLLGTIGCFSEPEALVNFIKGCYMTENECQMYCDMWNAFNKRGNLDEVYDIIKNYEKK